MTLNDSFFNEILEKEKYWMELADKKLLNVYYLNGKGGIKDFYLDRIEKIEQMPDDNKTILNSINNIISKIDSLTLDYRRGNPIDLNSLIILFLSNQVNKQVEEDKKMSDVEKLQIQKQVLQSLSRSYKNNELDKYADDYLYEEPDYKGKVA